MTEQLLLNVQLSEASTFETFSVGDNATILQALKAAVSGEGERFIYLFGEQGVGRTHLLQAACHLAEAQQQRSLYLPLSTVAKAGPAVLEDLHDFDVIALDDLNSVLGDEIWEEALFCLYNEMRNAQRVFLLAANAAPTQLIVQLPDLQSRLAWGLTFQVQSLSDADKIRNLRQRAEQRGFVLSEDVEKFLLSHCRRDMRSLISVLDTLDKASLTEQRRLTIPFVKQVLGL